MDAHDFHGLCTCACGSNCHQFLTIASKCHSRARKSYFMPIKVCTECGDEFIGEQFHTRCSRCFKDYMDSPKRNRSRSPHRPAQHEGDIVFKVGKHTGRSFREVFDAHDDYVHWSLDGNKTGQIARFADYSRSRLGMPRLLNTEMNKHFETLGVPSSATYSDVKQRFYDLARQNHSDVSTESSNMARLSSAWSELKKHFRQQGQC